MWLKLLRNYLPSGVKLNSVTVLGSKGRVIEACSYDQARDDRRKLYVIDGDLDFLRGAPRPRLRHLYRLRAYCVENYLLAEDAFISAITTLNPKIGVTEVGTRLDFMGWFDRNEVLLKRLFVCYAVTYELAREEQTVAYSVHQLLREDTQNCDLCEEKVFTRIYKLYRTVRKNATKEVTRNTHRRISDRSLAISVQYLVSGKDYIFPPLYVSIRPLILGSIRMSLFKVLVAECMREAVDPYLKGRLTRVCR